MKMNPLQIKLPLSRTTDFIKFISTPVPQDSEGKTDLFAVQELCEYVPESIVTDLKLGTCTAQPSQQRPASQTSLLAKGQSGQQNQASSLNRGYADRFREQRSLSTRPNPDKDAGVLTESLGYGDG